MRAYLAISFRTCDVCILINQLFWRSQVTHRPSPLASAVYVIIKNLSCFTAHRKLSNLSLAIQRAQLLELAFHHHIWRPQLVPIGANVLRSNVSNCKSYSYAIVLPRRSGLSLSHPCLSVPQDCFLCSSVKSPLSTVSQLSSAP